MPRTNSEAANRKARKSFTLSAESVAFLDAMRRVRIEPGRSALDETISDYYSSLTIEEAKEQALWGDFAERELSSFTSIPLKRADARL